MRLFGNGWLRAGAFSLGTAAVAIVVLLAGPLLKLPGEVTLVILVVACSAIAALSQLGGRKQVRPPIEAVEAAPVPLNFTALPPGGILEPVRGRERVEEELAVAEEYGRPLALLLVGLDVPLGILAADLEDRMAGLEEVVLGAVRAQDVVFQHGNAELLVMLPETRPDLARVVVARIDQRARAEVGGVRGALAAPAHGQALGEILVELEEALDLCRSTGLPFADPARLLQRTEA
ncbi:MAG: hypothetical protein E6I73_10715 [Chloroflexi bacterium]|nr:MAG: hypothetical protein E6I73_10715 [Chloroflexota bacterium]